MPPPSTQLLTPQTQKLETSFLLCLPANAPPNPAGSSSKRNPECLHLCPPDCQHPSLSQLAFTSGFSTLVLVTQSILLTRKIEYILQTAANHFFKICKPEYIPRLLKTFQCAHNAVEINTIQTLYRGLQVPRDPAHANLTLFVHFTSSTLAFFLLYGQPGQFLPQALCICYSFRREHFSVTSYHGWLLLTVRISAVSPVRPFLTYPPTPLILLVSFRFRSVRSSPEHQLHVCSSKAHNSPGA